MDNASKSTIGLRLTFVNLQQRCHQICVLDIGKPEQSLRLKMKQELVATGLRV